MPSKAEKRQQRVRRAAKRLVKAIHADVAEHAKECGVVNPQRPPLPMLIPLAIGAVVGSQHKRTCPSAQPTHVIVPTLSPGLAPAALHPQLQPSPMPPAEILAVVGGEDGRPAMVRGHLRGEMLFTDPAPGVAAIVRQALDMPFALGLRAQPSNDARSSFSANFLYGVVRAAVAIVWPEALAHQSESALRERLHVVFADAIADVKSSAAPPSGAAGPGGAGEREP